MNEEEIEQSFAEIQGLHASFNESNPLTYAVFLNENKDRLSEDQKEFLIEKAKEAVEKQSRISRKIMEKMDNELSRAPITEKWDESKNYFVHLDKENEYGYSRETVGKSEQPLCSSSK